MTDYTLPYVFWGRALPKISVYFGGASIATWEFSKMDNFRMGLKCLRLLDNEDEMEDGLIRQRIRGYRLYAKFTVSMIKNRAFMLFARHLWLGDHIVFTPHHGSMQNPRDSTYNFNMVMDSDFEPEYFDGRFIGHEIEFTLKGLELLPSIPTDSNVMQIIPAEEMRVGGVTLPNPKYSITFWGEKLFYGGWELSAEDFRFVAFWEQPEDPGEIDPYGVF